MNRNLLCLKTRKEFKNNHRCFPGNNVTKTKEKFLKINVPGKKENLFLDLPDD